MKDHKIFAAGYDLMLRSMEKRFLAERRAALVGALTGRVLDIGAGTGANLPHFRAAEQVVMAEPDGAMRARIPPKLGQARVPIELSDAAAEALPFPDASFDAAVCTLVLCTVPDQTASLTEIRRVLKPGGTLVLLEHVRAEQQARLHHWQHRISPVWSKVAAGCVLTRDTAGAVAEAGFTFRSLEQLRELPAWMPISPMIQGVAIRP